MPTDKEEQNCFYVEDKYFSFMIEDGRVARIDVSTAGTVTSKGIQIGDSENRVLQACGSRVKIQPHQYMDDGHYLTIRSPDGRYGMRFETEKGKVVSFYSGSFKAVQLVEGCQ